MTAPCFVDTNVFVYTIDSRDPRKQTTARQLVSDLLANRALVLSTQVLLEFFHASTRKVGYPPIDALAAMERFATGDVVSASAELVRSAAETSILEQQSIWDAMIIAAAIQRRCRILYSEDMGSGRRIRGVEIRNPFA
jgi:predicted nucleic acid-binding protein